MTAIMSTRIVVLFALFIENRREDSLVHAHSYHWGGAGCLKPPSAHEELRGD